jgi:methionyl-tRNA formyltransferase
MLDSWCRKNSGQHELEIVHSSRDLNGGDILFLIASSEIIDADVREHYRASLVVHASDLPKGRGWSPHQWQILEGSNRITVTLLEAEDSVDSGAIWEQREIQFQGHELFDEVNNLLYETVIKLMDFALENIDKVEPRAQDGREPSYYPKRTPEDSRIDPNKSIAEQFDLLRIADPDRYPAFLDIRGHRYEIKLVKSHSSNQ